MSKVHYKGLTDAQVLESRAKYGANVLTPPEEDSIWDQIKEVCIHPIAITMFILIAATAVLAGVLVGSMGTTIFVMPAIVAIATYTKRELSHFSGTPSWRNMRHISSYPSQNPTANANPYQRMVMKLSMRLGLTVHVMKSIISLSYLRGYCCVRTATFVRRASV